MGHKLEMICLPNLNSASLHTAETRGCCTSSVLAVLYQKSENVKKREKEEVDGVLRRYYRTLLKEGVSV